MKRHAGFTLAELLIVMVIIGILASIAMPAYRESVRKSDRRAAQAAMMNIANLERQYFIANRSFAASKEELNYDLPPEIADKYSVVIAADAGPPPGFTITLTPEPGSPQAGDVVLTLNSAGEKGPEGKW